MNSTLEQIDPTTLVVGVNVREDARLDPESLASVKECGVLEPIVAHRDEDGTVVVDRGQRRTLAACQAGLPTVPVVVRAAAEAEVDRVVHQVVENDHRAGLTNRERVRAVDQLALLGVPAGQIAKRMTLSKEAVAAAQQVARSETAIAYVDAPEVTLEQVALLAEFENDEEATKKLVDQLNWRPENLAATAQRIRDDLATREQMTSMAKELADSGVTVIEPPAYDDKKTAPLRSLRDGKGRLLKADKHAECPGHVAWVEPGSSWMQDSSPKTAYGCQGWARNGHQHSDGSRAKVAAADMTEEQHDQARRERRHVVESNKDWKAATAVRRRWMAQQFAARKTAPAGAETLVAAAVAGGWPYAVGAAELLGTTKEDLAVEAATAAPRRALQIAVALVVANWEASLVEDAWRATYRHREAVQVLQAIAQWGHQLSDIEQRIVDGTAAEPARATST